MASSVDRRRNWRILGCSGVSEYDQLMLTRVIATLALRNMLLLYPELDLAVLTARAGVAGYVARSLSPTSWARRSAWMKPCAHATRLPVRPERRRRCAAPCS